MQQLKQKLRIGVQLLSVLAICLIIYYLADINHKLIRNLFPSSSEVNNFSVWLHAWGFALATVSILINFKAVDWRSERIVVCGIFAFADGAINALIFWQQGWLGASMYGVYTLLIMFFVGMTVHDLVTQLFREPTTPDATTTEKATGVLHRLRVINEGLKAKLDAALKKNESVRAESFEIQSENIFLATKRAEAAHNNLELLKQNTLMRLQIQNYIAHLTAGNKTKYASKIQELTKLTTNGHAKQ